MQKNYIVKWNVKLFWVTNLFLFSKLNYALIERVKFDEAEAKFLLFSAFVRFVLWFWPKAAVTLSCFSTIEHLSVLLSKETLYPQQTKRKAR